MPQFNACASPCSAEAAACTGGERCATGRWGMSGVTSVRVEGKGVCGRAAMLKRRFRTVHVENVARFAGAEAATRLRSCP